jgi:DNA-binding LytR/AlgR family response regulator
MNGYIYFNSRDVFFRIELARIVYFEADKNYTVLYLNNGQKIVFTFSLGKMLQYLIDNLGENAKNFARIGKSYIINLGYLYQIDIVKQTLKLYDASNNKEFTLPVSKEALKNLKALYIKI